VLKGLLLFQDYDRYRGRLKRPIGHDLEKLVSVTADAFALKRPSPPLAEELRTLNSYYKNHWLRYGSAWDIFQIDINARRTLHRIAAVVRLAERRRFVRP
jgi:hypothetical protein